jgi:hypothetical protein
MAKTYDWERVTGITTKQVDPSEVVKLAEKGKPLSGALKDVADIAGNYPEIARLTPNKEPLMYQRLRRGGAGGTIGFAMGGPVGAALGAGVTSLASEATANMLARPGAQNRLAIPMDRRIPFPTEPVVEAAPIPRATFVGPEVGGPPQLGYGGTMETLAAEKARAAQMSRTLGQQDEARQAAADAVDKARQKAAMFEDIAKRAADQQARNEAIAKRQQMMDLADTLEENLRAPRPVSKGAQGPKTREFRKNMLSQGQDVKNTLIELRGMANKD